MKAMTVCSALQVQDSPAVPVWVLVSPAVHWEGEWGDFGGPQPKRVGGARIGAAHVNPRCPSICPRPDGALGRVVVETRSDNPVLRYSGFCKWCTHQARPRNGGSGRRT